MILTEKQKEFMKTRFEKPVQKADNEMLHRAKGKIIVVGDKSTLYLIENGIEFDVCAVDYHTQRTGLKKEDIDIINGHRAGRKIIEIDNPQGTLSEKAVECAKQWAGEKMFIIVHGEDDMVALPFMLYAPEGYYIIYGIRGEGMIIKKLTKKFKEEVRKGIEAEGMKT